MLKAELWPNKLGWTVKIPGYGYADVWGKHDGRLAFRVNLFKEGARACVNSITVSHEINDPVNAVLTVLKKLGVVVQNE